jgi:hypothetical protein
MIVGKEFGRILKEQTFRNLRYILHLSGGAEESHKTLTMVGESARV